MNKNLKSTSFMKFTLLVLLTSMICSCAKKENMVKCDPNSPPPMPTIFELRDKEGRDLLNPSIPGHYDSLQLMNANRLHKTSAYIIPPHSKAVNPGKYMLALYTFSGQNTVFYLNETDADTIRATKIEVNVSTCDSYIDQIEMFYNNKAADAKPLTRGHYFIAIK